VVFTWWPLLHTAIQGEDRPQTWLRSGRFFTNDELLKLMSEKTDYDMRRDDWDIFENTKNMYQNRAQTDAHNNGAIYPLVTRVERNEKKEFHFTNWRASAIPKAISQGECLVGKIVIGIFSRASDSHLRSRQRSAYSLLGDKATLRSVPRCTHFVYVVATEGLDSQDMKAVKQEASTEGDLEFLENVHENMNEGKSFAWFDTALKRFPDAQYIAKMDQDSFVHPTNLVHELEKLPRTALLYGADCGHNGIRTFLDTMVSDTRALDVAYANLTNMQGAPITYSLRGMTKRPVMFMCGMFYLFSRDLAQCFASSPWVRKHIADAHRNEDQLSSSWLLYTSCPVFHYAAEMFRFYDYGSFGSSEWWQRLGWHDETVCVHQLKQDEGWANVKSWLKSR